MEPANVTRLEWIGGQDGKLPEGVRLGEVAVMSTGRWGRELWAEVGAGEGGGVHFVFLGVVGLWCRGN